MTAVLEPAVTVTAKGDEIPLVASRAGTPTTTFKDVVHAVTMRFPQFDEDDCIAMLAWLKKVLARTAPFTGGRAHPSTSEMQTRAYDVFDMVVPHDKAPVPGSPHAILSRYITGDETGKNYLMHWQARAGVRKDCNVAIGHYCPN